MLPLWQHALYQQLGNKVVRKVVRKVLPLEYVDMGELLPETWQLEEAASDSSCCSARGQRTYRGPVMDIGQWSERFAALAAILSTWFPEGSTVLELFADHYQSQPEL